jgi:phage terminase Nu1 subunit (DNA packaging protein)
MHDIITVTALAELFGISTRAVSDLARRGIVARTGSGYALAASVKGYCGHPRKLASRRGGDHRAGMTRRVVVTRGFCEIDRSKFARASSHRRHCPY